MQTIEEEEAVGSDVQDSPSHFEILKLRQRWELASVLHFLDVFSPLLGNDLKVTAEEIEIGLVKPNAFLTNLHIQLLKGIPPVGKALHDSDKWVTALSKKLTTWWPWVAEGKNPLVPSKGEEISKYKELDPLDRLLLLKALCEVRADQHDVVSYINDALKEGTQISSFRKEAFGIDGTRTSYWYDANTKAQSHRLYRETITSVSTPNRKGKGCLSLPNFQWETLATNLDEFSEVAEKLSSSKSRVEIYMGDRLQSDAIPVLEKLQKKKERAMKQKERQDKLLKDFQNSFSSGNTRSCRTRRPINYSFEAYDRTIKEAIQLTNKRKKSPAADQDRNRGSEDDFDIDVSADSDDSKRDTQPISESDDAGYEIENHSSSEENDEHVGQADNSEEHSSHAVSYPKGVRSSKRIAGVPGHTVPESMGLTAKQRVRQRPTRNTAIESTVVPDSEDESDEGKTDLS
ncbi:hypothetical protein MtrunA17_Chr3g0138691 [Medicago truncatula]|uniref:DDT domain-containing protein DDR4 n=1 Tax=Medicago truncatula TaxID=3880 RepID=G7JCA6_MEDTR|nr:DDT domain-containing protein DDR4 [Medicago truncatula]AES73759.2 hypothetical protein MTR_3g108410 [Medicago truncatula]RHN70731.1 hypothetical protein MtrunA17_Chr3g0138691 [Medicago truncatula]